jgi:hypothetical protein
MIKCIHCDEIKTSENFYIQKRKKNGLSSWCKECHFKNASMHNKNNRKHVNRVTQGRAYKNPKMYWCGCILKGHKQQGNIIEPTKENLYNIIKEKEHCYICGNKLNWERNINKKEMTQNPPSLDRKNNENVINKDNILIICRKCNTTKLNRSFEEFILYCKNVVEKFGDK